ncbi:MAG: hypothetical protein NXH86_02630 [Flavobacteriaceae bacterium]|uniref:hypothetical protein n=1 Tax=Flagellimonas sp. SN16 TaxID=3415142 RepID=UPI003C5B5008|nr:hypothetical protein [Flavobacteriaceae bacterium]
MGKILIYDDEESIVRQIKSSVRRLRLGLVPIEFTSLDTLREYIYSEDNWDDVKAVVFDLAQKKEEDEGIMDFEILEDIKWCYLNRRIPIFIHSAYADQLEVLKQYPTVLLFKKGGQSIKSVRECLELFEKTGFFDLFCEGPLIKDVVNQLNKDLKWGDENVKKIIHEGFIDSFKGGDIIQELKALLDGEDVSRQTYLKYLEPVEEQIKNLK